MAHSKRIPANLSDELGPVETRPSRKVRGYIGNLPAAQRTYRSARNHRTQPYTVQRTIPESRCTTESLWDSSRNRVVELPDFVPEIPELLRSASIAVLPSYYSEGVPLFLLAALASALPIITTTAPGYRDTVVDGANGILIPPRDPVALADAIEQLVRDEVLRSKMGHAGRKLAEERFSTERVGAVVCELYTRIM